MAAGHRRSTDGPSRSWQLLALPPEVSEDGRRPPQINATGPPRVVEKSLAPTRAFRSLARPEPPTRKTPMPRRQHPSARLVLLLAGAMAGLSPGVRAQQTGEGEGAYPERGSLADPEAYPRPTARATRTAEPPRIDGRVDDDVWSRAELLTDFVQSQPSAGRLATERSEVRILYDDQALYVGAMLYDSHAGDYVVQSLERDFPSLSTRDADIFGITLDTFLDRRNSIIFLVNPYGAYRDGQTFDDSRSEDFGFDVPVEVKTALLDDGWSLEMRIPWSAVRYDAGRAEQAFGMNLLRRVRRINEDSYWAPLQRRDAAHRMSKAGTLRGITGIPAVRNITAKPYVVAADQRGDDLAPGDVGQSADAGFDVKYGLTPGLTLDLTYNTDFSQVEVDQERVNLTRFPLFFPEQRDFFVENSGKFAFGDQTEREYRQGASPNDFSLFHSRSIGLVGGRPVPILGGGRVSGGVGGWDVGMLDLRTESSEGLPAENFAVLRLRRKIANGSDVGAMFIDRSSVGGSDAPGNRSYGVDANFHLLGALVLSSYAARTETPGATGDQTATRFGAAWRDRLWDVSALWRRIGDDFDPGVGFVRRTDIEHTYATVGVHPRPGISFIQEVNPYVEIHHYANLGDTLVTRQVGGGVAVDFTSGATLTGTVARNYELVEESFAVSGGTIPVGGYDFDEASVKFQSSAGRPFSADVSMSGGGYYDGDRRSVGGGFRWLASHRFAVTGSADYNRIELPEGTFTSAVYSGRLKYAFSTRAFITLNVQYNHDDDQLVSYARFNLIHGPLSDFFVVLTERRRLGPESAVLERALTAKVTKLLAF